MGRLRGYWEGVLMASAFTNSSNDRKIVFEKVESESVQILGTMQANQKLFFLDESKEGINYFFCGLAGLTARIASTISWLSLAIARLWAATTAA